MPTEVFVKEAKVLLSKEYRHTLAVHIVSFEKIEKLTTVFIDDLLNDFNKENGQIIVGKDYYLRLHDELVFNAFGEELKSEWLEDLKRFATKLPERCSLRSHLIRYQILDAIFKIMDNPVRLKDDWVKH